jgi:hypothetical protein
MWLLRRKYSIEFHPSVLTITALNESWTTTFEMIQRVGA